MIKSIFCATLVLFLAHQVGVNQAVAIKEWAVAEISIDNASKPINVASASPKISWVLSSSAKSQMQSAYQVVVSKAVLDLKDKGLVIWDSKKIKSQSNSVHIPPALLKSNTDYRVKIISWNETGLLTTALSQFSTAYLSAADWGAKWIGYQSEFPANAKNMTPQQNLDFVPDSIVSNRSQYLRKEIILRKTIARARVFVCGLGVYELRLNGNKVGDEILSPAKTRYFDRSLYQVFDVKKQLVQGQNVIGLELGNGWYNTPKKYRGFRMPFYGYPRAILQLHITYTDRTTAVIYTDETWKTSLAPITANCIYDGEKYDARLEQAGWDKPNFNASAWKKVVLMEPPSAILATTTMPAEKVVSVIKPLAKYANRKGSVVYNMGQNFSGFTKISVSGHKGDIITLTHAENMYPDSTLDKRTNRLAKNTDIYILKGNGVETYVPKFTYHGFQYVDIAITGSAKIIDVEGQVVHNAVAQTGSFTSDNTLLNRIHHASVWSQKTNFHGLPTDCPQRDERLGWVADAYVTGDEALCNFDLSGFYDKWLDDMRHHQNDLGHLPHISPTANISNAVNWSCGYLIMVWAYYQNYGDKEFLKKHYGAMRKYINYLEESSAGTYILKPDRYGDWGNPAQDKANQAKSGWVRGFPVSSTTAMFYHCTDLMAKTAAVLGETTDQKRYTELKGLIATAYNKSYYDTQLSSYKSEPFHYQYAQALPIHFGITPVTARQEVLKNLLADITVNRKGHLYAGIIGTKFIVDLLAKEGLNQAVYDMVTIKGYPGWDFVLQGRNTFPEWWDGTGSHNHVMFASIDAWFYRSLAGINIDDAEPAYRKIIIKPFFPAAGLNEVKASLRTVKGEIFSEWKRTGNHIKLKVSFPANTKAKIVLPNKLRDVSVDGVKVQSFNGEIQVGSGKYELDFTYEPRV